MKTLIIYFSASAQGVTKNVAVKAAEEAGADTFSITPEQPYTEADINWKNPLSRCNKEKFGNWLMDGKRKPFNKAGGRYASVSGAV